MLQHWNDHSTTPFLPKLVTGCPFLAKMLAISPELLAGPDWAEHCEGFFRRFVAIQGVRLPGSRRHKNRLSTAPRQINAALIERIRMLC